MNAQPETGTTRTTAAGEGLPDGWTELVSRIVSDTVARVFAQLPALQVATPPGNADTLATLPDAALVDLPRLAALLGRHPENVKRAVRRGELPPPQRFMGKKTWVVATIRRHLLKRQEDAVKLAASRDARRPKESPKK